MKFHVLFRFVADSFWFDISVLLLFRFAMLHARVPYICDMGCGKNVTLYGVGVCYASFADLQRDFATLQNLHHYFMLIDGISVVKRNKINALRLENRAEIQRTRDSGGAGEGHGGVWGTLYTYNYTEVVF